MVSEIFSMGGCFDGCDHRCTRCNGCDRGCESCHGGDGVIRYSYEFYNSYTIRQLQGGY
jgi:hypothetical protein